MRNKLPEADVKNRTWRPDFSKKTYIMGVLNVTPDSFSGDGLLYDKHRALERALKMQDEGADIIDVGGESTRPGASPVSIDEELKRVIPVIEAVARQSRTAISIDTQKSAVAEAAVRAGAAVINDVSGLRSDREMAAVAARLGAKLVIMHMKGTPCDMQIDPTYKDLIREIKDFFSESISVALKAGVSEEDIILDPGIGFGKSVEHNLMILNRLSEFKTFGLAVCVGVSRKSFIGKILGIDKPEERLSGTIAACALAVMGGANILRVHDVKEATHAARIAESVRKEAL